MRLMGGSSQYFLNPSGDPLIHHTDGTNKPPWKGAVDKEFGLLGILDRRLTKVLAHDVVPVQLAEFSQVTEGLEVAASGVAVGESPGPTLGICPGDGLVKIGLEVQDRPLAALVGQFGRFLQ
jgi:hypothetical protein